MTTHDAHGLHMHFFLMIYCFPDSSSCDPPSVANGHISGDLSPDGYVFVGNASCDPGFVLVGEPLIKCVGGMWNQPEWPVCTREYKFSTFL